MIDVAPIIGFQFANTVVPKNNPTINDNKTFFVLIASKIAKTGGIIDKNP
ncbi:MAG: hypothetical protein J7L15_00125 [Clostridiales bacterium]|nr:hypothetical protein [Clostridiales bacterium]